MNLLVFSIKFAGELLSCLTRPPDQKPHQINQYTFEVFDLTTVVVSTVAEASADVGLPLTVGGGGWGRANGIVSPTPTAFRASVTANVTTLVKSEMFTDSVVLCATEISVKAFKDGVTVLVILAADLPACLADFLLGGMT